MRQYSELFKEEVHWQDWLDMWLEHWQKGLANIYDGIGESGLGLGRHARLPRPFVGIDMATKSWHQLRLAMLSYDGLAGHGDPHSWIGEPFL